MPVVFSAYFEPVASAVTVELGRVHALDVGNAGLIAATMEHLNRILKHVSALGQIVDEEVT